MNLRRPVERNLPKMALFVAKAQDIPPAPMERGVCLGFFCYKGVAPLERIVICIPNAHKFGIL